MYSELITLICISLAIFGLILTCFFLLYIIYYGVSCTNDCFSMHKQYQVSFFSREKTKIEDRLKSISKKWWITGITPTIITCQSEEIAMTSFCEAIHQDKCCIRGKVTKVTLGWIRLVYVKLGWVGLAEEIVMTSFC